MDKPSFKQYLEGKEQLRKAIENTPISIVEYEVRKYCSIALGESEDDQQMIGLKPKHKLIVQWRYLDVNNPTLDHIKFIGVNSLDEQEEQQTTWSPRKFQKWLGRHTTEEQVHGHKSQAD